MGILGILVAACFAAAAWPKVRLSDRLVLAPLVFVVGFYLLDILGLPLALRPAAAGYVLGLLALGLTCLFTAWRWKATLNCCRFFWHAELSANRPFILRLWRDRLGASGAALLTTSIFLGLVFLYRNAFLLPAHDSLAALAFGRAIASNGAALQVPFSTDPTWAAYPPGLPILVAPLFVLLDPVTALGVFKLASLLLLAATPLLWATFCRRIFALRIKLLPLCAAFAFAFFALDRSLLLGFSLAGKNSMLTAGALVPFGLWALVRSHRSRRAFLLAIVAVLGCALIHYSSVHLLAATLPAFLIVHWRLRRAARRVLFAGAAGLCAGLLFIPVLLNVRASGFSAIAASASESALRVLTDELLSVRSHFLFIFHDLHFVTPWPLKSYALLVALMVALLGGRHEPAVAGLRRALGRMALTFSLATLAIAIFSAGLIPGLVINVDYARWAVFFLQAALLATPVLSLASLATARWPVRMFPRTGVLSCVADSTARPAVLFVVPLFLVCCAGAVCLQRDVRVVRHHIAGAAASREDVSRARDLFAELEKEGPCFLVVESNELAAQFLTSYLPLDYAAVFSTCRFVGGSWLSKPLLGGRAIGGMPDEAALARIIGDGGGVTFLGTPEALAGYVANMPRLTVAPQNAELGSYHITKLGIRAQSQGKK